ncbi:MAG: DEAD/DEAH box helicase family protein [Subdoligranulum variabile]|nr:DEAD/DEAH box helicase family protein [Subdoligranulum variabile]
MPDIFDKYASPRPTAQPMIYAYQDHVPEHKGLLKVGYTAIDVDTRVAQQFPTKTPDGKKPYDIVFREEAMYDDGSSFTDHDVHRILERRGFHRLNGSEWFRCSVQDVRAAVVALKSHTLNLENRTQTFKMRPEQERAVEMTRHYFQEETAMDPDRTPKFLWNCKMRFGKTFAAYELAKRMGMKRILVLTFKPAVENAWEEDLNSHVDFDGWQFYSRNSAAATGITPDRLNQKKPIVCFGSFQDFLGTNENGGIKAKNEWVHTTNWDIVIFDEYHFGAWRENAKKLFEQESEDDYDTLDVEKYKRTEADNAYNESFLPITTRYYLYLSGTPFRALNSGEFVENEMFNWTYGDEQREKANWKGPTPNPYAALPRMVLMTYKIPDSIRQIAYNEQFNEFDLNVFFSAVTQGKDVRNAQFKYKDYVQKWLDLIRGAYMPTTVDDLKLGQGQKPVMPYSDARMLNVLTHTLWFLPNVASCYAMANLLAEKQNVFYHDYTVNVCAGAAAGIGLAALAPVQESMHDPLQSKTITLSCGKLTTGVTVKPWTGIFMLRNLSSPETYFQAAFRVQSPWTMPIDGGGTAIIKKECYVFDFALDRALKQIADYSCRLNVNESNPEKKVGEFINFLPVLAYDGSTMKAINAVDVLDIAMAGTSATLLARKWESALLVNVDNETLERLINNEEAMKALMSIEGFRALNQDIQTIINKSESVKKAKQENKDLTQKQKKQLTEDEKEYKSKRKQIQEKLIKFATRIPIFMYLTDYREHSLKDIITQLEPGLFKKVTGLNVKDFELLVSLNVFNDSLMNDAIYKFKRYEDSSLEYTGLRMHSKDEDVGLFSTVISAEDFARMSAQQDSEMQAPKKRDSIADIMAAMRVNAPVPTSEEKPIPTTSVPSCKEKPKSATKPAATPVTVAKATSQTATQSASQPIIQPVRKIYPAASVSTFIGASTPVAPANTPKVDVSDVRVGTLIKHKTFGEGIIVNMKDSYFTVRFNGGGVKTFVLPAVFENGLVQKID